MSRITNNFAVKYLLESKEEMKKVSWPSQKDTLKYSLVVIGLCVVAGLYFVLVDWILALGVDGLIDLTK